MSGVARAGAAPPPSIVVTVPCGSRMTHHATPPSPLVIGSTTPIANAAATAASTAFLGIDTWSSLEGLQSFAGSPQIREFFGKLFDGEPEVRVWVDSGWNQW